MRKLLLVFSFIFFASLIASAVLCPVCSEDHYFMVEHYPGTGHMVYCSNTGGYVDIGACRFKDRTMCMVEPCPCCGVAVECPYTEDCRIINCLNSGSITYCKAHKPNCSVITCSDCNKSYCEVHQSPHECICPYRTDCDLTICDKCRKTYCATHKSPHECKCPYTPSCSKGVCDVCSGVYCSTHNKHESRSDTCPKGAIHKNCGTPPVPPAFQTLVCSKCMRACCSICPHNCECPSVECTFRTCTNCGARLCNLHAVVHFCPDPPKPPTFPDDPDTIPPKNPNPDAPNPPPTPNAPTPPKPQTPPKPDTNPNVPKPPTPEPTPPKPSTPDQRPDPKTPETPAPGPVTVPGGGGGGGGGSGTTDFGSFSGENVNIQSYMLGQGENVVELPTYDYKKTGVDESKFDWIGDKLKVSSSAVAPVVSIPMPQITGCADLIVDFNNQTVARIVRIFRNFLSGILYIGAIIVFIKIIRTFEF